MSDSNSSWKDYEKKIAAASDESTVDAIEQELFGRKQGIITVAMKGLKDVPEDERKSKAQELNTTKRSIQAALDAKRIALKGDKHANLTDSDPLDATLNLPTKDHGHLHLIPEFIAHVEEVFGRMGFDVAYGPEIETEELNFNLLNIPEEHPARDAQDTFAVTSSKKGKDRLVLRTHTSPVQIRYMQEHKPPFRMICPGKVYRKDSDATHSPMFHQFEGLMIGDDITLANLKGILVAAMKELISQDLVFRFRTAYFPFVEPGLEMDMQWQGDLAKSREGQWLEMGGCGMVHPNVLKNVGIDPEKYQGFAFGFGIERPLMIKHQIPDLRSFYQGDLRFLSQF